MWHHPSFQDVPQPALTHSKFLSKATPADAFGEFAHLRQRDPAPTVVVVE
jgi:hypothetical protein